MKRLIGVVGLIVLIGICNLAAGMGKNVDKSNKQQDFVVNKDGKIEIVGTRGLIFEALPNNQTDLKADPQIVNGLTNRTDAWEKQKKMLKLKPEQLKKKISSKNYQERVLAYFYYNVRTNWKEKNTITLAHDSEKGWDQAIDKLIIDLHWAVNRQTYWDIARQLLLAIFEALDGQLVSYFETHSLKKYKDDDLKLNLMWALESIADSNKKYAERVAKIIKPLSQSGNIDVRKIANEILQKLPAEEN